MEIGALGVDFAAGDNSFQIKTFGLKPGEYGFVFRTSALSPAAVLDQSYTFSALFGFTIPASKTGIAFGDEEFPYRN